MNPVNSISVKSMNKKVLKKSKENEREYFPDETNGFMNRRSKFMNDETKNNSVSLKNVYDSMYDSIESTSIKTSPATQKIAIGKCLLFFKTADLSQDDTTLAQNLLKTLSGIKATKHLKNNDVNTLINMMKNNKNIQDSYKKLTGYNGFFSASSPEREYKRARNVLDVLLIKKIKTDHDAKQIKCIKLTISSDDFKSQAKTSPRFYITTDNKAFISINKMYKEIELKDGYQFKFDNSKSIIITKNTSENNSILYSQHKEYISYKNLNDMWMIKSTKVNTIKEKPINDFIDEQINQLLSDSRKVVNNKSSSTHEWYDVCNWIHVIFTEISRIC